MTKLLITIALAACIGCQSMEEKKKEKTNDILIDQCSIYPDTIVNNGLINYYDSAIWFIYMWNCTEIYKPKTDSLRRLTFGELSLKFRNFQIVSDTLEINFSFTDSTKIIYPGTVTDNIELLTGVGFNLKTKKKIYMGTLNHFLVSEVGENTRFSNPFQPQTVKYISTNWNKLNPCFKRLAIDHKLP